MLNYLEDFMSVCVGRRQYRGRPTQIYIWNENYHTSLFDSYNKQAHGSSKLISYIKKKLM